MSKKKTSQAEDTDILFLFIKKTQFLVSRYFKYILSAIITGFLILGLFFLSSYWRKYLNEQTAESLYEMRKELMLAERKAGGDILGFDNSQNFFEKSKKAKYSPGEIEELSKNYIAVIKKNIYRPAAVVASVELAQFLHKYEKSRLAVDLLQAASPYKEKNVVGFLLAFQLGSYLMDKAEYSSAIQELQFITENKSAKWLWPATLVKTALCYEKQNQTDQAKKMYLKVKKDFPDSLQAEKATQYLNLLTLQEKLKKIKGGSDGPVKKEGD